MSRWESWVVYVDSATGQTLGERFLRRHRSERKAMSFATRCCDDMRVLAKGLETRIRAAPQARRPR